jgi:hypothetical protein
VLFELGQKNPAERHSRKGTFGQNGPNGLFISKKRERWKSGFSGVLKKLFPSPFILVV